MPARDAKNRQPHQGRITRICSGYPIPKAFRIHFSDIKNRNIEMSQCVLLGTYCELLSPFKYFQKPKVKFILKGSKDPFYQVIKDRIRIIRLFLKEFYNLLAKKKVEWIRVKEILRHPVISV